MEEGLYITINSDDPPMFNTTLTNEYIVGQKSFNWERDTIEQLVLNAVNVTLLPENEREIMCREFKAAFERAKFKSLTDTTKINTDVVSGTANEIITDPRNYFKFDVGVGYTFGSDSF